MQVQQDVWYQTPQAPGCARHHPSPPWVGGLVSQMASPVLSKRVGRTREGTFARSCPEFGECGARFQGSLLGDSGAGMHPEQEAGQQECSVSAQGFV